MLRDLSDGVNGAVGRIFPERRLILRSETSTRYLRLSPLSQACMAALITGLVGWTAVATVSVATTSFRAAAIEDTLAGALKARETRMEALAAEAEALTARLAAADERAALAEARLHARHAALTRTVKHEQSLATDLRSSRESLASLSRDHDETLAMCEATAARAATLEAALTRSRQETQALSDTLTSLTGAIGDVAQARDDASAKTQTLTRQVDALSTEISEAAERRSRIFAQLEDAAAVSLGSLEGVFEKSGVKIEPILDAVRREYDGEGGPFIPEADFVAEGADERIVELMGTLERVNLLRIAADRLPFARPVTGVRFTSGFGRRKDPKNGRRAIHTGIDLAGPRGAAIHATAEGTVAFAGRRRGYGRVIEIQHDFGYKTVYAHLNKIRVKAGDRVARGDRIGDMGNSGRSTGVHLHYEVRIGDAPVNPLKYIEAARDVL